MLYLLDLKVISQFFIDEWEDRPVWILRFVSSRSWDILSTADISGLLICFFSSFSNSRSIPSILTLLLVVVGRTDELPQHSNPLSADG
jgi:hypothetical protein